MNICSNCKQNKSFSIFLLYFDVIRTISKLNLPSVIISYEILPFLYHLKGHCVKYNFTVYSQYSICSLCFQSGMYYSLLSIKRLPYSISHLKYFKKKQPFIHPSHYLIRIIRRKFLKYSFPKIYYCVRYRQTIPSYDLGFYHIHSYGGFGNFMIH